MVDDVPERLYVDNVYKVKDYERARENCHIRLTLFCCAIVFFIAIAVSIIIVHLEQFTAFSKEAINALECEHACYTTARVCTACSPCHPQ